MAQNLLLEIGLEEMPAHVVTPSMKQLQQKTAEFLTAHALQFSSIEAYSTPRRLAVYVTGIPESQADTQEEVKGPAKNCNRCRWQLVKSSPRVRSWTRIDHRCNYLQRIKWCGVCLCHQAYSR